ncbi:MAG: glycoside hydrolase family 15 protein [Burkholderiaceae bacterium]
MSKPIEDYALLGDGRSAALVGADGSVDWLCWPRFDSPACFAALLGTDDHGHWSIKPHGPVLARSRRYIEDTLVLETEYRVRNGRVRVCDFMPVGDGPSSLVRIVTGLQGTVSMALALALRFDHGRVMPWVEAHPDGMTATLGPDRVLFRSPLPLIPDANRTSIAFDIDEGDSVSFVLSHRLSSEPPPERIDIARAHRRTTRYWRTWIARFGRPTDWPAATRRSLLTLRALVYKPTGGMVAAPTTSLPEKPGGISNWDYRYCWLRDATFLMGALLNAGLQAEATAWRDWLLRAVGAQPEELRIAYRIDGATDLDERVLEWLPGYEHAAPVRVGNAAWKQHQLDVFGEVIDAMSVARRGGIPDCAQGLHVEEMLVRHLASIWETPDQGIWEDRGDAKHYVYSKVMAWVGVDRYLKGAASKRIGSKQRRTLERLRTRIHAEICARGYHSGRGTFVQHYDSDDLDASLLLLPALGFLPADDPRIERTIDAIEIELSIGGFVMRTATSDGTQPEGAFLPCTCWLADCRAMQGRHEEARIALERVLSVSNDLGLLSEEYDVDGGRLVGNFPQALTHLAVLNTTLGLCGPVLQRGGG